MGINPKIWGPPLWKVLHVIAFRAKSRDADACVSMVGALRECLPCPSCLESISEVIARMRDVRAACHDGLFGRWMYELHEHVSDKLDSQAAPSIGQALLPVMRARRPTLEEAERIAEAHSLCETDVWHLLELFAMDVDGSPEAAKRFQIFVGALADYVSVAPPKPNPGSRKPKDEFPKQVQKVARYARSFVGEGSLVEDALVSSKNALGMVWIARFDSPSKESLAEAYDRLYAATHPDAWRAQKRAIARV
jgi:hypothetical protein